LLGANTSDHGGISQFYWGGAASGGNPAHDRLAAASAFQHGVRTRACPRAGRRRTLLARRKSILDCVTRRGEHAQEHRLLREREVRSWTRHLDFGIRQLEHHSSETRRRRPGNGCIEGRTRRARIEHHAVLWTRLATACAANTSAPEAIIASAFAL
jgi:hypothetical protein